MRRGRFVKPGYLALSPKAFGLEFAFFERPAREVTTVGNVAVVEITGPLTHRSDYFWDSYEGIEARARAAFESDARAVCLRIDSPGGDVAGCFELARALRNMSAESGKELVAFCEGLCASAAYALACGATRIVAPGTANVGSVGVFEAMVDTVAADVAMGVRFIMVASGARKLDGHPHVPPTEAGVAAMQEKIDILAEQFFDLVAELRGLDPIDIRAIEGELLVAPQALTRGLIDSLGVYAETLESLQGETSMPVPPAKIAPTARAGGT
ncbi:MAG TPA: S49 family peptidase, partial [Gaiellaceae bacterium]|nr:S49 family peptidase [Gaiellaceae bacterium]